MRFPAVSTLECNLTGLPVYINAPRKNTVSKNGVELLTNIGRIGTTLTIENLTCKNFFSYDDNGQTTINNARIRIIPVTTQNLAIFKNFKIFYKSGPNG